MNASALLLAELVSPAADLVFLGVTVAFFAGAIAFARFCQKVR